MKVLLIDNYDSYTFNLFQVLGNHETVVIRNDQFPWSTVERDILPFFDCVIISPGPGRPDKQQDFGICLDLLHRSRVSPVPILGVCLGHQGIGSVFGARVVRAEEPMHGRVSCVRHDGTGLFEGVVDGFEVVRYHSLVVDSKDFPNELEPIAWTRSNIAGSPDVIMALRHKTLPLWGVQFHPESICTQFGTRLVDNFINLSKSFWDQSNPSRSYTTPLPPHIHSLSVIPTPLLPSHPTDAPTPARDPFFKRIRQIYLHPLMPHFPTTTPHFAERLFETLSPPTSNTPQFWLDSAKVEHGRARFSYMGAACGEEEGGYMVRYSTLSRRVTRSVRGPTGGLVHVESELGNGETLFHWMSQRCEQHGFWDPAAPVPTVVVGGEGVEHDVLPEFTGGYVGYFGYEMKCESMPHAQGFRHVSAEGETPDAMWMFVERVVALDHVTGVVWCAVVEFEGEEERGERDRREWVRKVEEKVEKVVAGGEARKPGSVRRTHASGFKATSSMRDSEEEYIAKVETSLERIREGETYEVCLTTKLAVTVEYPPAGSTDPSCSDAQESHRPTPFDIYKRIRARNPAPYGSFLSIPHLGLSILQSSPERFLKFDGASVVEMKPIKGTVARPTAADYGGDEKKCAEEDERRKRALGENEKDRAENLMIVDLIRNDLHQISHPHTVTVPHLMHVESYATVHQLVSTIRCTLRKNLTALDAVRATFPPGSMTGAPKLRTVQILEDLEGAPRGLYSGCLGFMAAGSGVVDLNVVIRTVVVRETRDRMTAEVGAGGAIVVLSEARGEFEEMVLKSESVLPSVKAAYGV
ncbi:hypothetical protein HDU98_003089 [Podochytrium sp. JEL0797]|nr:hypothetical protein HDU98_003089 [Podochytrium sp. JEL0797]